MACRAPLLATPKARRRSRLQRDRRVQHRLDGAQRLRLVDDQLYSNGGDLSAHRHGLRTQPDVHNDPLHHYKRRRRHQDSVRQHVDRQHQHADRQVQTVRHLGRYSERIGACRLDMGRAFGRVSDRQSGTHRHFLQFAQHRTAARRKCSGGTFAGHKLQLGGAFEDIGLFGAFGQPRSKHHSAFAAVDRRHHLWRRRDDQHLDIPHPHSDFRHRFACNEPVCTLFRARARRCAKAQSQQNQVHRRHEDLVQKPRILGCNDHPLF